MTQKKKIGGYTWDAQIQEGRRCIRRIQRELQKPEKPGTNPQVHQLARDKNIAFILVDLADVFTELDNIGANWKEERINNGRT